MPLAAKLRATLVTLGLALIPIAHAQQPMTDASRAEVVAKAADLMRTRYIFPEVGEQAAKKIEAALAAGAYKDLDTHGLARKLTDDIYAIARDKHMRVSAPGLVLAPTGASAPPPGPRPPVEAGITRADKLAGNIGYLEVVGFPSAAQFATSLDRAMASLADTRALIIDIRANGGGSPEGVAYLVSFFLDGAKPPMLINDFQNRKPGTTELTSRPSYSLKTPTSYLGKPLYVLTSPRTFSGGEEFAYDVQSFKLGTLVGETTGGGANPGGVIPLGSQLGLFVPGGRPINPVTKTNWEGVGVIPEIKTPVEDALKVALEKLGEKPAARDIATLSQARLFSPRTTAQPNSEAALRRIIGELAIGQPNYDLMTPNMADTTRNQLPSLHTAMSELGAVKVIRFMNVENGADVYDVTGENGAYTWRLALNGEGKLATAAFSRNAVATPTDDARMAAFKANDPDGDGKIDKAAYAKVLETLGFANQLDQLFTQRDVNRDGQISTEEYKAPIAQ